MFVQKVKANLIGRSGSLPWSDRSSIAGAMPYGWVHRQLQEGRAVVLVDGIDEVPASLRPGVYVWLDELITMYPQARFMVTARPYAASKDDLPARERLKEAQVLPMNLSAIEDFITQWHHAVAANLQDAQERHDLHEAATRLIIEIRTTTHNSNWQRTLYCVRCSVLSTMNGISNFPPIGLRSMKPVANC